MGRVITSKGWPLIFTEGIKLSNWVGDELVVFSPFRLLANVGFVAFVVVIVCLRRDRRLLTLRLSLGDLFLLVSIVAFVAGDWSLGSHLPEWIDGDRAMRSLANDQLFLFPYQPLSRFDWATYLVGVAFVVSILVFTQGRSKTIGKATGK